MQMMTVSSLNTKIKSLLEATFMHILVEGEVSSVTYHSSGHLYFSIKDDKSAIKCVMWRSSVARMKFRIEKGMHIVVEGSVSVYTPRGEYQFQTVRIEPYGKGALALAFEQLKQKLKEKGYFDASRKQTIPKQIRKIALVTAKESAALHDMLKIIEKRWPLLEVVIVDTPVQGEPAARLIAKALRYADGLGADVIVVGRGGGSAEDLWSFNEEEVADAIYGCSTPVVSAVGHEVDVMISDYVADLRAPTPSAAMEMILPDRQEILFLLDELWERYGTTMRQQLHHFVQRTQHLHDRLEHLSPLQKLTQASQRCDRLQEEYQRMIDYQIERKRSVLKPLIQNYRNSIHFILRKKEEQIRTLQTKAQMSDPALREKKGWAQVIKEGHPVDLDEIAVDDHFVLQNMKRKVQVKALDIETLDHQLL
jgi:exodeoxyribonuclease VII large subunit